MSALRRERQAARAAGSRKPVFRLLEAVLWAAVAVLLVVRLAPQARAAVGWPRTAGVAAPEVTLPLLAGGDVRLADLEGQVVLVNFWATWCPPCRAEMPEIQNAYEKYRTQNFTVLAVDVAEDEA